MFSSSGIDPPDAESASARQRNRRPNNASSTSLNASTGSLLSGTSERLHSQERAPRGERGEREERGERGRIQPSSGTSTPRSGLSRGFEGPGKIGSLRPPPSQNSASSWVPNWSSIQEFASTLLANGDEYGSDASSTAHSRSASGRRPGAGTAASRRKPDTWGPAPPGEATKTSNSPSRRRPGIQDLGVGTTAAREAELRARKTASVLESHPGVNGGLDVRGKYKRRTSDEDLRGSAGEAAAQQQQAQQQRDADESCLVYIHHIQPTDTYFGIVLKYRCRDDVFRRANGLWTRDNIQIRQWVALPVDACEVKGRPCDGPSDSPADLLAPTPNVVDQEQQSSLDNTPGLDGGSYFSLPVPNSSNTSTAATADEEVPWTHVRWVRLDENTKPVEIGRMSRSTLGFFPPRRKKSLLSNSNLSAVSTPRQSLDQMASRTSMSVSGNSPARRSSTVLGGSNRPVLSSSPMSTASAYLGGADEGGGPRPAWMQRPGGVGSMSKSVRAPGPARDYFNKWTTKHLPGLNIESLPSMSIMGSETARFGFGSSTEEPAALVESAAEDGRDVNATSRQYQQQQSEFAGIDKAASAAAAAVETWLRGAFAKRPGTPSGVMSNVSTPGGGSGGGGSNSNNNNNGSNDVANMSFASRIGRRLEEIGDLIELEDGPRKDDRNRANRPSGSGSTSSGRRTEGSASTRSGRGSALGSKGKKAD